MSTIFQAIQDNDFNRFVSHLNGAPLDEVLLATARQGRLKMLQHCLQKGAQVTEEVLTTAREHGHEHVVHYLFCVATLGGQARPQLTHADYRAALIAAVVNKQPRVFDLVLEQMRAHGNIEVVIQLNPQPATEKTNPQSAELKPDDTSNLLSHLLTVAAANNDLTLFKKLIDAGAKLHHNHRQRSAYYWACKFNNQAILDLIAKNSSKPLLRQLQLNALYYLNEDNNVAGVEKLHKKMLPNFNSEDELSEELAAYNTFIFNPNAGLDTLTKQEQAFYQTAARGNDYSLAHLLISKLQPESFFKVLLEAFEQNNFFIFFNLLPLVVKQNAIINKLFDQKQHIVLRAMLVMGVDILGCVNQLIAQALQSVSVKSRLTAPAPATTIASAASGLAANPATMSDFKSYDAPTTFVNSRMEFAAVVAEPCAAGAASAVVVEKLKRETMSDSISEAGSGEIKSIVDNVPQTSNSVQTLKQFLQQYWSVSGLVQHLFTSEDHTQFKDLVFLLAHADKPQVHRHAPVWQLLQHVADANIRDDIHRQFFSHHQAKIKLQLHWLENPHTGQSLDQHLNEYLNQHLFADKNTRRQRETLLRAAQRWELNQFSGYSRIGQRLNFVNNWSIEPDPKSSAGKKLSFFTDRDLARLSAVCREFNAIFNPKSRLVLKQKHDDQQLIVKLRLDLDKWFERKERRLGIIFKFLYFAGIVTLFAFLVKDIQAIRQLLDKLATLANYFKSTVFDDTTGTTCGERFPGITDTITGSLYGSFAPENNIKIGDQRICWSDSGQARLRLDGSTSITPDIEQDFNILMRSVCKKPALELCVTFFLLLGENNLFWPFLTPLLILVGGAFCMYRISKSSCMSEDTITLGRGYSDLEKTIAILPLPLRERLEDLNRTHTLPLEQNLSEIRQALKALDQALENEMQKIREGKDATAAPHTNQNQTPSNRTGAHPLALDAVSSDVVRKPNSLTTPLLSNSETELDLGSLSETDLELQDLNFQAFMGDESKGEQKDGPPEKTKRPETPQPPASAERYTM